MIDTVALRLLCWDRDPNTCSLASLHAPQVRALTTYTTVAMKDVSAMVVSLTVMSTGRFCCDCISDCDVDRTFLLWLYLWMRCQQDVSAMIVSLTAMSTGRFCYDCISDCDINRTFLLWLYLRLWCQQDFPEPWAKVYIGATEWKSRVLPRNVSLW